jgi:mono/diheme cytochrome c family protein
MRKIIKWVGIVLGVFVGLIVIAAVGLMIRANLMLTKHYVVQPEAVTIPADAAAVQHGQHLAEIVCVDCHGPDLAGRTFFSSPAIGSIVASNLTPAQGGAGATFTDADWVRAIRHGVAPNGRGLVVMPADGFYYLSDADLGALIAYLKTLPPVTKALETPTTTPLGSILTGAGALGNIVPAEVVPHTAPRPLAPESGRTAAYGGYLVEFLHCTNCHGQQLSGGRSPDPQAPIAPNLTPGGEPGLWKEADFIQAMRTGVVPSGRTLTAFMPWKTYGHMTDDELGAVWLYLNSLPKLASTTR